MSKAKRQAPTLPKGTRDFYPESMRLQNFIFDTWKRVSKRFGYEEYEGPIFEHLELFTGKSGDEIVSQLYHFEDKGNRALALRPEMTPTLARLIVQKGNTIKKPFKWFSIPRLFRYERAQKGRLREFFQLNLDVIGTESVFAEADLISAIVAMLVEFGLSADDFSIGISSRELLANYLIEIGVSDPNLVYPVLDRRLKTSPEAFLSTLLELGLLETQVQKINTFMESKSLNEIRTMISSPNSIQALNDLQNLFDLIENTGFGPYIGLDLSIVRGLAYYTGIVFEVFDRAKSMRAIAGGGRYDNLCENLGGQKVPGVGFGMGDVVLANLLKDHDLIPDLHPKIDLYIASFTNDFPKVFVLANQFRELHLNVAHPLEITKLSKQMDQANSQGARCVVYVDGEKATENTYEFKDLSKGLMHIGSIQDIVEYLKNEPS